MNDLTRPMQSTALAPAIDAATLEPLLDMGGPDLRVALCAQLTADFQRLNAAIGDPDGAQVTRAVHELKGLASTVGAGRLASMARSFETALQGLGTEARAVLALPPQREIARVLDTLADAAKCAAPDSETDTTKA